VLHLDGEKDSDRLAPAIPVDEAALLAEVKNPIGALQKYCQTKALPMLTYEFEDVAEGFFCNVWALGLTANSTASAKKKAKAVATALLLGALARVRVYRA
jgi:hypothetical protein